MYTHTRYVQKERKNTVPGIMSISINVQRNYGKNTEE